MHLDDGKITPGSSLLVLGGTRGIGLHIARCARDCYERVVVLSRTRVSTIEDEGLEHLQVDICDPQAATRVLQSVQPQTLVMSASIGRFTRPERAVPEEIHAVCSTTFAAQVQWLTAALREMPCRSKIGWLSSLTARIPSEQWAVYGGAKAGVEQFLRSVRGAFAKRGISITVCYPGCVATGFHCAAGSSTPPGAVSPAEIGAPLLEAIELRHQLWAAPMDRECIEALERSRVSLLASDGSLLR